MWVRNQPCYRFSNILAALEVGEGVGTDFVVGVGVGVGVGMDFVVVVGMVVDEDVGEVVDERKVEDVEFAEGAVVHTMSDHHGKRSLYHQSHIQERRSCLEHMKMKVVVLRME